MGRHCLLFCSCSLLRSGGSNHHRGAALTQTACFFFSWFFFCVQNVRTLLDAWILGILRDMGGLPRGANPRREYTATSAAPNARSMRTPAKPSHRAPALRAPPHFIDSTILLTSIWFTTGRALVDSASM